jgi:hypothetical protein
MTQGRHEPPPARCESKNGRAGFRDARCRKQIVMRVTVCLPRIFWRGTVTPLQFHTVGQAFMPVKNPQKGQTRMSDPPTNWFVSTACWKRGRKPTICSGVQFRSSESRLKSGILKGGKSRLRSGISEAEPQRRRGTKNKKGKSEVLVHLGVFVTLWRLFSTGSPVLFREFARKVAEILVLTGTGRNGRNTCVLTAAHPAC